MASISKRWFVPTVEVAGAVALFAITSALDRGVYDGAFTVPPWVIGGTADAARQILAAVAASIITVVGVVFSITIVARPSSARACCAPSSVTVARRSHSAPSWRLRPAHFDHAVTGPDGRRPGGPHLLHQPHRGRDPAVDRLVEIALRALSPAVNDTFTAMTCIDWLGDSLCRAASAWYPTPVHRDRQGFVRVPL